MLPVVSPQKPSTLVTGNPSSPPPFFFFPPCLAKEKGNLTRPCPLARGKITCQANNGSQKAGASVTLTALIRPPMSSAKWKRGWHCKKALPSAEPQQPKRHAISWTGITSGSRDSLPPLCTVLYTPQSPKAQFFFFFLTKFTLRLHSLGSCDATSKWKNSTT